MSTIYRKSGRRLCKIDDSRGMVTCVLVKLKHVIIETIENADVRNDVIHEPSCTEEEFNTAYKEAMARIQMGRLDI